MYKRQQYGGASDNVLACTQGVLESHSELNDLLLCLAQGNDELAACLNASGCDDAALDQCVEDFENVRDRCGEFPPDVDSEFQECNCMDDPAAC